MWATHSVANVKNNINTVLAHALVRMNGVLFSSVLRPKKVVQLCKEKNSKLITQHQGLWSCGHWCVFVLVSSFYNLISFLITGARLS